MREEVIRTYTLVYNIFLPNLLEDISFLLNFTFENIAKDIFLRVFLGEYWRKLMKFIKDNFFPKHCSKFRMILH